MATIKSYSDLQQSKKLAEILPLEGADMFWLIVGDTPRIHVRTGSISDYNHWDTCIAWSLSALLSVLPKGTDIIKEEADTENEQYMCTVGIKNAIISTFGNNPVDACYEMIIKLYKQKLL